MVKIIALSVVGCLISIILKQNCKELILPFNIAFAAVVLIYIFDKYASEISGFTYFMSSLGEKNDVIPALLKASLVSVAVKISGDICKESGNILMQDMIELGGRAVIFTLSLPYIMQITKICFGLLK